MVDRLTFHGHRYVDENFKEAQAARERLMIELDKPLIQDTTFTETSLITQKFETVSKIKEYRERHEQLTALLQRADSLLDSVISQDKGTGALHDIALTVHSLKSSVESEIKIAHTLIIEIEKFKEERKMTTQEFEAEKKEWEKKRAEKDKEIEHLKRLYREIKNKQNTFFLTKLANFVTWPFNKIFKY
ncbi:GTPase IMAP family member 6 [Biomphalaria pfeifferi]|uniref:GTPase IMAP family member 6 n=1 Tax=Biomphalaria pfeifferi TaxID=112525 RepID=A0AAD8C606_BIOPF|nr:GTPase IMAP family member 6 [Biomphalaria pfeifferi]